MIFPLPLLDEVHTGYWGRIIRWNGLKTEKEAIELLISKVRSAGTVDDREPGLIELLAYSSSMSVREFVRLHTQLPYRRSIASYKQHLVHGDEAVMSMIRYSANRFSRTAAYFCETCVESDLVHHGISYWRRSHQLPGMYVCPMHGDALHFVESVDTFMMAPSKDLENCEEIDGAWAMENHENRYVQEFLRLSIALSVLPQPISLAKARTVLTERAKLLSIAVYPTKNCKYRLSDKILSRYPGSWLELVFPRASDKKPGHIQHQLDGVLYCSTSASSVVAYLLGACVLFDSAEEFLQALARVESPHRVEPTIIRKPAHRTIELHEALASYIRCSGDHGSIAREQSLTIEATNQQLLAFGLPNLAAAGKKRLPAYLRALQGFYIGQMPISDCAQLSGLSSLDLEHVIRQSGVHLVCVLRQIEY